LKRKNKCEGFHNHRNDKEDNNKLEKYNNNINDGNKNTNDIDNINKENKKFVNKIYNNNFYSLKNVDSLEEIFVVKEISGNKSKIDTEQLEPSHHAINGSGGDVAKEYNNNNGCHSSRSSIIKKLEALKNKNIVVHSKNENKSSNIEENSNNIVLILKNKWIHFQDDCIGCHQENKAKKTQTNIRNKNNHLIIKRKK